MPVIRIGDLTTYAGDTSGSWLVVNDPTNTTTYKAQKEQLLTGEFFGTASYAATSSIQVVSSSGVGLPYRSKIKFNRMEAIDDSVNGQAIVTRPPDTFISSSAPANPVEGDVWTNNNTWKTYKYYDNFWVEQAAGGIAVRTITASLVSFIELNDTPKSYSGQSGSVLIVSSSETGLVFKPTALFDILDFGAKNFTELLDVPDSYLGQADKILVVSSSETGLQFRGTSVINSSDFGAQTFTELTDVPASYLGQADKVLVVSSSETGLQFRGTSVIDSSDFGVKTFVELTDAPDNYIAKSGFLVAVSGSETGLEFVPTASLRSTDFGYKQFIELTDTPSTYSGKAGFLVSVSGSENALEFVPTASFDSSSFGYKQFIELTDTPSTYSGKGGFVVAVSGSQNALEFIPTASFDSSSFGYKQFIELTDTPSTYSGKEGFLVAVSSSANALEFIPTASLTGFFPIGMQDMYVGAEGFYPTFVSGCAPMATSYIPPATVRSLDFDAVTEENAQYTLSLPRNWDNSPIQTKIYWTVSGSQSGSVVWAVKAAAYSNAFSLTASFSTEYIVSSSITGSVLNTTPYTAYITPSGSIQTGSLIIINVARKPDNANDNLSIDAKMIGMSIKYATNRATAE